MPAFTATELKNATADVFHHVSATGAVAITRHDKPRAVILSLEEYVALLPAAIPGLDGLRAECEQMYENMQSPEAKAAAERAFNATTEQLADAAVRRYRTP